MNDAANSIAQIGIGGGIAMLVAAAFSSHDDDLDYSPPQKPIPKEVHSQWYKNETEKNAIMPLDVDHNGTFDTILVDSPDMPCRAFYSYENSFSLEQITQAYVAQEGLKTGPQIKYTFRISPDYVARSIEMLSYR